MKREIAIAEATSAQLRALALELGCSGVSNPAVKADTVIAKLREAGYAKETIEVEIAEQQAAAQQAPAQAKMTPPMPPAPPPGKSMAGSDEWQAEPFHNITIQISETENGDKPVWVDVNGRGIWIPRGEMVQVRRPYVQALNNAEMDVYDPQGKFGSMPAKPRKAKRFPFTDYGPVQNAA